MFAALLRSLWNIGKADIVFVGYMGHFITPILRLVTKKVIVFDAFLSIYDMLCYDREYFRPDSFIGKITRIVPAGPLTRVEIDCGFPLIALVTKRSAAELDLKKGKQVHATFKATGVHVIKRSR